MSRSCSECAGPMPVTARRDARFCASKCRVRAHRRRTGDPIPEQLRAADRWMRFRLVPRAGKMTKVPTQVNGRNAKSTDPSTWSSYADASVSKVGAGLGFALGDGFACLDLDQCVAPDGTLSALAQRVLSLNPDAWVELSVSGTGLHVWGLMDEQPGQMLPGLEVYSQGRFIALGTTYRRGGLHPLITPRITSIREGKSLV